MATTYRFLVDANLPRHFTFFRGEEFVHQLDLAPDASDSSIWQKAQAEGLVILTRDTDFFFRCQADPSVKVIHLQLGNIRLRDLHAFFDRNCAYTRRESGLMGG